MQKSTGENLKKKPLDTKKIFNKKRPTNQKKKGNKQQSINGNGESRSVTSEALSIMNKNSSTNKKLNYSKNSNYLYNAIKSKQSVESSFFSKKSDVDEIVNLIANGYQHDNQSYFENIRDNLLENNNSQNQIEEDCLVDNYNCLIPTMPQQIIYGHSPIVNKKQPKKHKQAQSQLLNSKKNLQRKKTSNTLAVQGLEDNKKCKCKCWCY